MNFLFSPRSLGFHDPIWWADFSDGIPRRRLASGFEAVKAEAWPSLTAAGLLRNTCDKITASPPCSRAAFPLLCDALIVFFLNCSKWPKESIWSEIVLSNGVKHVQPNFFNVNFRRSLVLVGISVVSRIQKAYFSRLGFSRRWILLWRSDQAMVTCSRCGHTFEEDALGDQEWIEKWETFAGRQTQDV